ncbi:MAG: alpha/beta hydrolase [Chloroflexota bacterium]
MPLDPQVKRYLAEQTALNLPPPETLTAQQQRDGMRSQRVMKVEDRAIPRPGGTIPVRIYTPPLAGALPALVYFHGGGFVVGDLDTSDFVCRLLNEWARCVVVSVDYRMAPEHVFPAAVEDCYAATAWVAEHASELRVDPTRIAVGGDSAGGNLAAVVALMARDEGTPQLVFQYLAYPVTDTNFETASYRDNAEGYGLGLARMRWFWDQYVPDAGQRNNPLAAPLRAESLAGLPPALVATAEFDPLRDEGEAYARRMAEAGVKVELRRYDGLIHGFLGQTASFAAARGAFIDSVAALSSAFGTS